MRTLKTPDDLLTLPVPFPSAAPESVRPVPRGNFSTLWERRLQELLQFHREQGHYNVPRTWAGSPQLANWVSNQRRLIRLDLIDRDRLHRLQSLGIVWEGLAEHRKRQEEAWDRMYGALKAFHRSFGHLEVPRRWRVEPKLSVWLCMQRHLWRTGALPASRDARLRELNPDWHRGPLRERSAPKPRLRSTHRRDSWEGRYRELLRYRDTRGSCAIPARWTGNPALALWVVRQRVLRKRGALSDDRIDRLDDLGFVWDPRKSGRARLRHWERMFESLLAFHRTHGPVEIPRTGSTRGLSQWLQGQRRRQRGGRLPRALALRLEAVGFLWSATPRSR